MDAWEYLQAILNFNQIPNSIKRLMSLKGSPSIDIVTFSLTGKYRLKKVNAEKLSDEN